MTIPEVSQCVRRFVLPKIASHWKEGLIASKHNSFTNIVGMFFSPSLGNTMLSYYFVWTLGIIIHTLASNSIWVHLISFIFLTRLIDPRHGLVFLIVIVQIRKDIYMLNLNHYTHERNIIISTLTMPYERRFITISSGNRFV